MIRNVPVVVLLHPGPEPALDLDTHGFAVRSLRIDDIDPSLVTLSGMAREALPRLPAYASTTGVVLAGLGDVASVFAQALALELLGRDHPVAAVAAVPDAALGLAGAATQDDRLVSACAAWTRPEPNMLRVQNCPVVDAAAVAEWLARIAATERMPPPPPAVMALPLKIGGPLRAPIICIPGAGASVVSLLDLAQRAHAQATVYGMQPRGIDGVAPPCTSVETVAQAVVAEVGALLPHGPLRLLGHSFGGWVVFEVALRLRALGRSLVSVDLLDSRPPDATAGDLREADELNVLMHWVEMTELSAERGLDIDASRLADLSVSARVRFVHQRMHEAGLLPPRSDAASILGALRMFAACLRTRYAPEREYDGTLRVVHMRDPALDAEDNDREAREMLQGWSRRAQRVELIRAEGNHMTGIRGEHARALAQRLGLDA